MKKLRLYISRTGAGLLASLLIALSVAVILPATVSAAPSATNCAGTSSTIIGFPTWYKYLKPQFDPVTKECKLQFDVQHPGDLGKVALAIAEILLRVGGLVAVGFVVYGGVLYILSMGDPQKAVSARRTIINAVIGMVIALMATFIVTLVGKTLIS